MSAAAVRRAALSVEGERTMFKLRKCALSLSPDLKEILKIPELRGQKQKELLLTEIRFENKFRII